MKAIFQLSKADIQSIVAAKFGLVVDEVEVVIKAGLDALTARAFMQVEDFIRNNQKIAAIKELRTAAPQYQAEWGPTSRMGLKQAKDAVEDWANYRNACEVVGKLLLEWPAAKVLD